MRGWWRCSYVVYFMEHDFLRPPPVVGKRQPEPQLVPAAPYVCAVREHGEKAAVDTHEEPFLTQLSSASAIHTIHTQLSQRQQHQHRRDGGGPES
jgi:hypothetical protein